MIFCIKDRGEALDLRESCIEQYKLEGANYNAEVYDNGYIRK